jgi:ribonuclease HI
VNAGKEGAIASLEFGVPGMTTENPKDADGVEFVAGDGPLPQGAEDGFDPNVLLDPATGKMVYKTVAKKAATKTQAAGIPGMLRIYTDGSSLRNGTKLASAGVGVYFGPGDSRFVHLFESLKHGAVILTHD